MKWDELGELAASRQDNWRNIAIALVDRVFSAARQPSE